MLAKKRRVTSAKLAISFSRGTAAEVKKAAKRRSAGNVSAWLEEAARKELRHQALASLVADYEAEHGKFTKEEMAAVEAKWPRKG